MVAVGFFGRLLTLEIQLNIFEEFDEIGFIIVFFGWGQNWSYVAIVWVTFYNSWYTRLFNACLRFLKTGSPNFDACFRLLKTHFWLTQFDWFWLRFWSRSRPTFTRSFLELRDPWFQLWFDSRRRNLNRHLSLGTHRPLLERAHFAIGNSGAILISFRRAHHWRRGKLSRLWRLTWFRFLVNWVNLSWQIVSMRWVFQKIESLWLNVFINLIDVISCIIFVFCSYVLPKCVMLFLDHFLLNRLLSWFLRQQFLTKLKRKILLSCYIAVFLSRLVSIAIWTLIQFFGAPKLLIPITFHYIFYLTLKFGPRFLGYRPRSTQSYGLWRLLNKLFAAFGTGIIQVMPVSGNCQNFAIFDYLVGSAAAICGVGLNVDWSVVITSMSTDGVTRRGLMVHQMPLLALLVCWSEILGIISWISLKSGIMVKLIEHLWVKVPKACKIFFVDFQVTLCDFTIVWIIHFWI